jgi:hypothetical protein
MFRSASGGPRSRAFAARAVVDYIATSIVDSLQSLKWTYQFEARPHFHRLVIVSCHHFGTLIGCHDESGSLRRVAKGVAPGVLFHRLSEIVSFKCNAAGVAISGFLGHAATDVFRGPDASVPTFDNGRFQISCAQVSM